MTKIIICGITGRMGKMICDQLSSDSNYHIVGGTASKEGTYEDLPIYNSLSDALLVQSCDCIIDFTILDIAKTNIEVAIENSIPIIVGTTGFDLDTIEQLQKKHPLGSPVLIVPNFSIGAIMLGWFVKTAAKYFKEGNITDLHHLNKKDSPSGTSNYLRHLLLKENPNCNLNVHSYRIGDFIAEHEITFLSESEQIIIKHDSYDRVSFLFGIKYCLERLNEYQGVQYGIENIIQL